jgi:hypothetical protein
MIWPMRPAPLCTVSGRAAGGQPQRWQSGQHGLAAGQGPACAAHAATQSPHTLPCTALSCHSSVARQREVSGAQKRRTGSQRLTAAGADWAVASGAPAERRLCEGRRARQAQAPADLPQLLAAVHRRHQELAQRLRGGVAVEANEYVAALAPAVARTPAEHFPAAGAERPWQATTCSDACCKA